MNTTDNRPKAIAVDMGGTTSGSGAGGGGGAAGTLQYGSSGNDVRALQTALSGLGYNVGTVDGVFGNQTKNAVMQYQKAMGLSADGIVGSQTWGALNSGKTPSGGLNYNDVVKRMADQNPQVSKDTVSQMTVPEVIPTAPVTAQPAIPNYNDVLNDLAAKNPQVSPDVVEMLRVPDPKQTGNGGNPTADAVPAGGSIPTGGNAPTGGNVPTGGTANAPVQQPTSQDILTMYDEQNAAQGAESQPITPPTAEPAAQPTGYTPPERNPYYEPNYRRLLEELEAYPEFSYDPNSDPIWASLAKQYRREGQRATADALGQAAGLTGGIASTAAVTAAGQAGDYYASQLSDRLQDVYNSAYQKYLDQYSRLMGLADEYRWGTDFEEGQFTGDRSFDRGVYTDDRNFDYDRYLSDRDFAYQKETDAYNRQQTSMQDAQSRVASYISMGGDPAQLDPALVQQSGFSANELQQMRTYYAQQAAAAAAKTSGVGGGSGGSRSGGSRSGGSGSGGASTAGNGNIYDSLYAGGATDYGTAYAMLLSQGYGVTAAKQLATYYADTYYPGVSGQGNGSNNKNGNAAGNDAAQLMAIFPGGIVKSAKNWNDLVKAYGADWLAKNGFRYIAVPSDTAAENIPVSSYGSGNYSGLGDRLKSEVSASYFEDGRDDFNAIEAEYQAAVNNTGKAVAFIKKYGKTTPVSESEFSRSAGMTKQYGTYQSYIKTLMDDLMS